jgi:hypothetical protein
MVDPTLNTFKIMFHLIWVSGTTPRKVVLAEMAWVFSLGKSFRVSCETETRNSPIVNLAAMILCDVWMRVFP